MIWVQLKARDLIWPERSTTFLDSYMSISKANSIPETHILYTLSTLM